MIRPDPPLRVLDSALDLIGNTPLVRLSRMVPREYGSILAKLEFMNPGASKKDRVARTAIARAKADGRLRPGQPVIEMTSGNMGTGLAIVCQLEGHPFIAVMSRGNSVERATMMRAFGAEVVLVDQAGGSIPGRVSGDDLALVDAKAREISAQRGAYRVDQFRELANVQAHYEGTGPEILAQTGGHFDAFCDFAGTGGTFMGCAAAFKEANPGVQCYLVEPSGAAAISGEPVTRPSHQIQGGGYAMGELPLLDRKRVDGYLQVEDEEARLVARQLAAEEGLFAGFSSGANVAAALQLLRGPMRGKTVVTLLCDSGMKYLSTPLWNG
ncbi:MAG: cysteine synthase family protein [Spirochaetes bacterium]|nr:cysteine synthase family protein [Spirochaetota bacterium]